MEASEFMTMHLETSAGIRNHLEAPGVFRNQLEACRISWRCLVASGRIGSHLDSSESIPRHLGSIGNIYKLCPNICSHLQPSECILKCLGSSGSIRKHPEASGIICKHLQSPWRPPGITRKHPGIPASTSYQLTCASPVLDLSQTPKR